MVTCENVDWLFHIISKADLRPKLLWDNFFLKDVSVPPSSSTRNQTHGALIQLSVEADQIQLVVMAMTGSTWKLIVYHASTVYLDSQNDSSSHTILNQLMPDIHGPEKPIVPNGTCCISKMMWGQFLL